MLRRLLLVSATAAAAPFGELRSLATRHGQGCSACARKARAIGRSRLVRDQ